MLGLWAQSYLGGVNKIICASKAENDTTKAIKQYNTGDIITEVNLVAGIFTP